MNTSFTIKDRIRIGENAYITYKQNPSYTGLPGVNNANSINAAFRMPTIVPVYDIMGNFAGGGSQGLGNAPNPVAIMERTKNYEGNNWSDLVCKVADQSRPMKLLTSAEFAGQFGPVKSKSSQDDWAA